MSTHKSILGENEFGLTDVSLNSCIMLAGWLNPTSF